MTLNTTESRIPGGFTKANADKLGYATDVTDHLCMVSFLPQALRFGDSLRTLFNNYVVFGDAAHFPNGTEFTYGWTIEYLDSQDNIIHTFQENREDYQVSHYWFRLHDQGLRLYDLPDLQSMKVKCTVTVDGNNTDLILTHQIQSPYSDIEALFTEGNVDNPVGRAGNPSMTHYVANIYREFFQGDQRWEDEDLDILMNIPVSILYSRMLKYHYNLSPNRYFYENGINDDNLEWSNNHRHHQVGLCGIKPYLLAMSLGIIPFQRLSDINQEQGLFDAYLALNSNNPAELNKVDILNYARFPKSNILLTAYMLSELKKKAQENNCTHCRGSDQERNTWKLLSKEGMAYEKDFIRNLLTEYFLGPQTEISSFEYRSMGKPTKHDWASYLVDILEQSYVYLPFELLKVKVLDIRSGQPIKQAKVKRLKILYVQQVEDTYNPGFYEMNFDDEQELLDEGSLLLKCKKALIRFYSLAVNEDDLNENDWGQLYSDSANTFLTERRLNDTITLEDGLNGESVLADYSLVLQYIVDEYNKHGYTDEEGVLHVRIPQAVLDRSYVHLEVGFHKFTITPEAVASSTLTSDWIPISRNHPGEVVTNFELKWKGGTEEQEQITDWQTTIDSISGNLDSYKEETNTVHFGWQVVNPDTISRSYLTVCTKLTIKDDNYAPFEALNPSFFCHFYDEIISPYPFVLFGMQWCQPVFDEFEDADEGILTDFTYIQNPQYKKLNMHLVTLPSDLGGSDKYGGKGYGKVEVRAAPYWRSVNAGTVNQAHLGLDIHAKIGDPVFAVRYGKVDQLAYSDTGGNMMRLSWSNTVRNSITYLHLLERLIDDDEMVLPGTRLGLAGRTGNLGVNSGNAGHVHLNVGADPEEVVQLRNVPDEHNKIAIPFNEIPLLLPCACQVTNVMGITTNEINNLSDTIAGRENLGVNARIPCRFDNTAYVGTCWAAAELKCPHINTNDKTNIQLQILLRYLNEKPGVAERIEAFAVDKNPQYLHPGGIDGDIGNAPATIADSSLAAETEVEKLASTKHGGKLIKIRYTIPDTTNKETTWVESSLVDTDDKLTEDLTNLVSGGSSIGASRMAIYLFRKEHDLLDFDDYSSNFSPDDDFWTELHDQTNLPL